MNRVQDHSLMRSLAAQFFEGEVDPQGCASFAWAMAKLLFSDSPLLDLLAQNAHCLVHEFTMRNLANISWAFAKQR